MQSYAVLYYKLIITIDLIVEFIPSKYFHNLFCPEFRRQHTYIRDSIKLPYVLGYLHNLIVIKISNQYRATNIN